MTTADVQQWQGALFVHAEVTLPLVLVSEANRRDHYRTKGRRVKEQREHTRLVLNAALRARPTGVRTVTLVRLGPRAIRDDDNLVSACKAVRDGVADYLRVDDGDKRISWRYYQEPAHAHGVRVVLDAADDKCPHCNGSGRK